MPRIIRGLADRMVYHILNRGNGKQQIFYKEGDYRIFITLLREARDRYPVKIFSYCLMPNHFHLVVMPDKAEELSKWMQWLMTSHVRYYHNHHGTSGHVWQGRFKSFMIQEDIHLLTVIRYVEGNPVKAGLVNSAKDWLWSSHRERIEKHPFSLIEKSPIELPDNWSEYVDEPITEKELEKLKLSINRQAPYGLIEWQEEISKNFGLESTIRPRGRPRKQVID